MPGKSELAAAVESLAGEAAGMFASLRDVSADVEGVTRASYGAGENAAAELVAEKAASWNLPTRKDHACNIYVDRIGSAPELPVVMTGSHLDSVPRGGNYDGAAGVVAGLLALRALDVVGAKMHRTMTLMGTRGEESAWFSVHHIGSRAALGLLPASELDSAQRFDTRRSLADHMAEVGADIDSLRRGDASVRREAIRAFLELHIEQGPVLEHRGSPLGIVSGIRGNFRVRRGRCLGVYAHSGAVPRDMRRDAVLAMAEFVGRAETAWKEIESRGGDLVLTFGQFHTDSARHTHNKVPGEVAFTVDARSHELHTLDQVEKLLQEAAVEIGRARGVTITLDGQGRVAPAPMDGDLRALLRQGIAELRLEALDIASGGGHDAGDFSNAGVPSAMIFLRNPHGSHNPAEDMLLPDFMNGVKLLAWTMARLGGEN